VYRARVVDSFFGNPRRNPPEVLKREGGRSMMKTKGGKIGLPNVATSIDRKGKKYNRTQTDKKKGLN